MKRIFPDEKVYVNVIINNVVIIT